MKMTFQKMIVWMLIIMLLLPAGAFASPKTIDQSLMKQAPQVETALFDGALSTAMSEDEEQYDVLIYLSDQVDSSEYAVMGENAATYVEREAIAQDYIAALQEKAALTQRPILNYLSHAEEQGLVAEYEGLFVVNVIRVLGNRAAIEAISRMPGIEKMELNQSFQLDLLEEVEATEDPIIPDSVPWNIEMIKANKVWEDYKIDGTGSVVGIIDSGVQFVHPALKSKWRGYDPATDEFVDPEKSWYEAIPSYFIEQSPYPVDGALNHGTHVAGIVLGSEAGGKNTIGVAPGAKYIATRAFDGGGNTDTYIMLRAGQWMLAPGGDPNAKPDVVNASWTNGVRIDDWYKPVINAWRAADIVPVFASGNLPMGDFTNPEVPNNEIGNPANYKESFAVGSVESNGSLSYFSLVGPSRYNSEWIKPDISAPGGNIRSSIGTNNYGNKNGTSMAAPHVSGVVALMRQADPDLSVTEIETILKETAVASTNQFYPTSPNMGFGYGVVDAYNAISEVLGRPEATIQGRVTIPGADGQKPTVNAVVPDGVFKNQDFTISASAADNLGVETFEVEVTAGGKTTTLPLTMVQGTQSDGQYEVYIPAELVIPGPMTFVFTATDANGNQTTITINRTISNAIDPSAGYLNNFETNAAGFRFTGIFERGQLATWVMHDYSSAPSGAYLIGNNVDGWAFDKYKPGIGELPPINMADVSMDSPFVSYVLRNYSSAHFQAELQASTDLGKTWQTIKTYPKTINFWMYDQIDLSEFKGTDTLFLRFYSINDGDGAPRGLFIDDVSVGVKSTVAPLPPVEVAASSSHNGGKVIWNKSPNHNVEKYHIYRSEGGQAASQVGEIDVISETFTLNKLQFTDTTAVDGKTYDYHVTAIDYFGNESVPSNTATVTVELLTALYDNNFDTDNGGLIAKAIGENGVVDWNWGEQSHQSGNVTKMWATTSNNGVTSHSEYELVMPKLTIPAEGASIAFDSMSDIWYSSDPSQTAGNAEVQISKDNGATWDTLIDSDTILSWNMTGIWRRISANIGSEYAGEVTIRFWFKTSLANSNPSYPEYGWHMDNLLVYAGQYKDIMVTGQPEEVTNYDLPYGQLPADMPEEISLIDAEPMAVGAGQIPINGATVRVLETGQATRTDQVGNYYIRQGMVEDNKTVTVEASAYGYHSKQAVVNLTPGIVVEQNFELSPLGRGTIRGTVTDDKGQPVAGVNVSVQGISTPGVVQTGADGTYVFNGLYEGTYNMRFVHPDYRVYREENVVVTPGETTTVDVSLTPAQSFDEWIIYDNGHSTDSIAFNDAGNGFAVRFTAEGDGVLNAGNLYFVDDWPQMYGREINIGVLDINLENGDIETLIPFKKYTINRGEWNIIDFSQYGVELKKGDTFFITTQQIYSGGNNPALGIDSFSPYGDESFGFTGTYQRLIDLNSETPGSLMIRAKISYERKDIFGPIFTNIEETHYTNKTDVTLEGTVSEDGQVEIYLDDVLVDTVSSNMRKFTSTVTVSKPSTKLMAKLVGEADRSADSQVHTIIYDTTKPSLTLDSHKDGQVLGSPEVVLSGLAKDTYFDKVLVNGYTADMEGDRYSYPATLKAGLNTFEIDAFDKAGNRERINLSLNYDAGTNIEITSVSPETDIKLLSGEDYTITVTGSADATVTARVTLPIGLQALDSEITLTETSAGVYTGTWTSPKDTTGKFYVTARLERSGAVVEKQSTGMIELTNNVSTHERMEGSNRYHTAVLFSQGQYDAAETVILANGLSNVDALAATPLALATNAPILLTGAERVPEVTQAEIERLGASNIILIGGNGAISQAIEDSFSKSYHVTRLSGANRYVTSHTIAEEVLKYSDSTTVLLASGQSFIDAASAGPASKVADPAGVSPIVFVDGSSTQMIAGTNKAILMGGTGAITEATEAAVKAQGHTTERVAGKNRYHTATVIAETFFPEAKAAVIANGIDPVDAIAAGPYAGNNDMPILLVGQTVSPELEAYITASPIQYFVFAGGTAAVSNEVAVKLINLIW